VFVNLLGLLESEAERIFIRSKYDKGFKYPNQEEMDTEIRKYGTLIKNSVFKRNALQTINTRKLTYEQRYAVKNAFNEIIQLLRL
jgi:chromosome partitioning protein